MAHKFTLQPLRRFKAKHLSKKKWTSFYVLWSVNQRCNTLWPINLFFSSYADLKQSIIKYRTWSSRHWQKLIIILSLHCNENPIYVFPEKELSGLSHNFHIHVSVCELYNPRSVRIGPATEKTDRSWEYINRSQTNACRNWDWGGTIPFLGNGIFVLNFRYCVFAALSTKWTSFYIQWSVNQRCNSLWPINLRFSPYADLMLSIQNEWFYLYMWPARPGEN